MVWYTFICTWMITWYYMHRSKSRVTCTSEVDRWVTALNFTSDLRHRFRFATLHKCICTNIHIETCPRLKFQSQTCIVAWASLHRFAQVKFHGCVCLGKLAWLSASKVSQMNLNMLLIVGCFRAIRQVSLARSISFLASLGFFFAALAFAASSLDLASTKAFSSESTWYESYEWTGTSGNQGLCQLGKSL